MHMAIGFDRSIDLPFVSMNRLADQQRNSAPPSAKGRGWTYLLAVVLPLATVGGRMFLGDRLGEYPTLIIFTIPIILCAFWGGLFPGLLATLVSYLGTSYFLLPPVYSFAIADPKERWQEMAVILAGFLISIICELLHRSRRRAEKVVVELQHKESELKAALGEWKQAEITSSRLAAIVESSDDAIIGKNLDGIVTSWNHGAEKIFGYLAHEMVGRPILRLIPPERHQEETEILTCVRRGGSVSHLDTVRRRKDGTLVDVSITTSAIKDVAGKIMGASKIARDITDRKMAERALRQSEAEFRTLAEAMPHIVWATNAEGENIYFNQRWMNYTGLTLEESLGRGWNKPFHPEDQQRAWTAWQKAVTGMDDYSLECRLRRADGVYGWWWILGTPVRAADGTILKWFGTCTDITERKQMEDSRRASEARYRTLFDYAPDGIVVVDAKGYYLDVNASICQMLGYTRDEFIGLNATDIVAPVEIPYIEQALDVIKNKSDYKREWQFRRKDGSVFAVDTIATAMPDGNLLAVIRDITERKTAEEKIYQLNIELERRVIERTAQLEAANKELEAFSYSVSHDLRAPLRAVNGFAGIVLEEFSPLLPEKGRDYLGRIRNSGQRMGVLIDDLLEFSRLSRLLINRRSINTVKVVQNVLDELKPLWAGRQVEIKVGELPVCHGDPALLKQVWVNLISNAVKYTLGREPAIIAIGCTREKGEDVFFVCDNGAGFDMQYADKLFGVFQRLHRSDEFEGTGVGLAIVQRIVHRHGGRVWAHAELNHGATFHFTLEGENQS
jgi:PAS domain S-box-containing protein